MKNILNLLLSLSIFAGFIWGCILLSGWVFGQAGEVVLKMPISTSLALCLLLALFGILWIAFAIRKAGKYQHDKEHLIEKRRLYGALLQAFNQMYEDPNQLFSSNYDELQRGLLLLGEGYVLNHYKAWRKTAYEYGFKSEKAQSKLEKLLNGLRRSLGTSNRGVLPQDLLPLMKGNARLAEEKQQDYHENGSVHH